MLGVAGKFWLGMAAVGRAATGRAGGAWSAGPGVRRGRVRGVWLACLRCLGWDALRMVRRQGLAGLALLVRVRLAESRCGRYGMVGSAWPDGTVRRCWDWRRSGKDCHGRCGPAGCGWAWTD